MGVQSIYICLLLLTSRFALASLGFAPDNTELMNSVALLDLLLTHMRKAVLRQIPYNYIQRLTLRLTCNHRDPRRNVNCLRARGRCLSSGADSTIRGIGLIYEFDFWIR